MKSKKQNHKSGGGEGGPHAAVGIDEAKPEHQMIPVWFFVGLNLLIYGLLIFATGIYEFSHPARTVLSNLHAAVWWGALLAIIGGVYVYVYMPWRKRRAG